MLSWKALNWVGLLAQNEPGPSSWGMFPGLLIIVVLFYFLLLHPDKKKRKDHQRLLEGLKKNDRVLTIGGIYGVVTNIQRDSDEVTIKVDEATNSKLRITIGSIGRVLTGDAEKSGKK